MRRLMVALLVLLSGLAAGAAPALEGKPKLGPDAVPMTARTEHLRTSPAPDYWKLSAFYVPQFTSSACSVASVAMAVNFARGLLMLAIDLVWTTTETKLVFEVLKLIGEFA